MRPVPAPEPPAPPDAQPAQTNTARRVATSIFIGTNFVEQRRVAVARRSIIGRRILRASPSHAQQAGSGELASGHSTFRPFDLSTFRPFDHRPSTIDIDHRPSGFGLRASGFGLRASGILPFSHLTARRLRPPRPVQSAPSPIAHQPDPHRPSPEFVRAPRMSREPRPTMNRKPKPKPRRREPAPRPSPTPGPQPQPAQKATTSRAAAGAPINLGTHSIFQRTAKHRTRYAPTLESSPCSEVRPCPLPIATTISPA
ncbi:Uncharacterised protein [Burkholderia pseudomallei]|nr:Uncharacterised protein [Burkholderia pseudomallei]CAJ3626854.1 Uncharacterised protein [Burkholderia pseudomallei]CAJ3854154.1 Uncharacterised protein [Burkholderia pseudomallei]CAJ4083953.1 Uncharacterised protein [Burkholderia pseudomallei]CAJ4109073.1 Uncharacterised protein [Burkholderia pseudomallei]